MKVKTVDVVTVEGTISWANEGLVTSDPERDLAFAKDKEQVLMREDCLRNIIRWRLFSISRRC